MESNTPRVEPVAVRGARRRAVRRLASVLALALAGLASGPAHAAPADAVTDLRDAISAFADSLPAPVSKADKKLVAKLAAALRAAAATPETLAQAIAEVSNVYALLPAPAASDPALDAVADAVRNAVSGDAAAALDALEADLAAFGTPGPAPVAAIRKHIAKARDRLAAAADVVASDKARFAALAAAGKKLAAALSAYAKYEATRDTCGAVAPADGVLPGSVTLSMDGGAEFSLPTVSGLANGADGIANVTVAALGPAGSFAFTARGIRLRPGVVPVVDSFNFDYGVRITFSSGGTLFQADTGTFTITSIRLKAYPKGTPDPFTHYVQMRGRFTGSGHDASGDTPARASVVLDFDACEAAYDPR